MDGEPIMPRKVQELGIKNEFRFSPNNDAFEIIIPVTPGHAAYLPVCFNVAVEKELQLAIIQLTIESSVK
jgi:hypothetical protein